MRRIYLAVLIILLLTGCASHPPRWAGQMRLIQGKWYFSGVSPLCPSAACAYQAAYEQALGNIAQYLSSQISVRTEGRLDDVGGELEITTEIISRQIELKQVKVEEFTTTHAGKYQTGFILVSVTKQSLEQVQQQLLQQEQERARRKQQVFAVIGTKNLLGVIQQALRKEGFSTGKQGQKLYVWQDNFLCVSSQLQPIFTGELRLKTSLGKQVAVFSEKGYGTTCSQAREEALEKIAQRMALWVEETI